LLPPNVRVERSAAALTLIEATLFWAATSLYPFRSYRPRSRSNALLDLNNLYIASELTGQGVRKFKRFLERFMFMARCENEAIGIATVTHNYFIDYVLDVRGTHSDNTHKLYAVAKKSLYQVFQPGWCLRKAVKHDL
jgi:hypothetical protein